MGVNGAREASTYYRSTKAVTSVTKLKIFADFFVMGLEAFVVLAALRQTLPREPLKYSGFDRTSYSELLLNASDKDLFF